MFALRFPRPCRFRSFSVNARLRIGLLPGDLIPSEPSPKDSRSGYPEAIIVFHLIAMVVAKGLLIQITKQMKWLNAHIGSSDAPLQEAPEILKTVGVNQSIHVLEA
jgi:hypothetical protein